jgi:hypothetical protein
MKPNLSEFRTKKETHFVQVSFANVPEVEYKIFAVQLADRPEKLGNLF